MTRVKRGVLNKKKRSKTLKYTKGFGWRRKTHERAAKEALLHAWTNAFRGRKQKKRDYRTLWTSKINSEVRNENLTYSKFINALKKKGIKIDRKILADLAENNPAVFKKILSEATS
ncbi:MAG TPA: 50S ribosomal protein L20 [Candidatus Paceibacterota bacterium]